MAGLINLWRLFRDLAPRRFAQERGQKFVFGFSSVGDVILDGTTEAVGARFPSFCATDALQYLGRDRRLVRGPNEATASFRARLKGAFDAWTLAGTVSGLTGQLEAFGLTGFVVIENHQWDDPWPHDPDNWSRFWVVVPEGGHPWTTSIPSDDEQTLRKIIRAWKPAHTICVEFIAITGGRLVDFPLGSTVTVDDLSSTTVDDNSSLRFAG